VDLSIVVARFDQNCLFPPVLLVLAGGLFAAKNIPGSARNMFWAQDVLHHFDELNLNCFMQATNKKEKNL